MTRPLSEPAIRDWLVKKIAYALGKDVASVPTAADLTSLGVSSMDALDIYACMGEELGLEPDAGIFWSCPTIEAMARELATLAAAK